MKMSSLEDLLVDELKDLYSAENQLLRALPKMAKAAKSKKLKSGFTKHLRQTEGQVERLKKVCAEFDVPPTGKTCKAMQGLIEEGQDIIEEDAEPDVKDAALISAAQKVEHYEIAGYGCARTYAELLGHKKAARLLQQTLKEEGQTDKDLTKLARTINLEAEKSPKGNGRAKGKRGKSLGNRIREAVGFPPTSP